MYSIEHLIYLMARLRHPDDGCPWDIKQDYRSITPSTIEEVYEVVDAIEREDYSDLKEELGDLLFQVVFYSRLAEEEKRFNLNDVIDTLTSKLIRRHPYVFPDGTLNSRRDLNSSLEESQIKQSWESIKSEERKIKGKAGLMADIPNALPAITRSVKLQSRAAKVGFDWQNIEGVLEKFREELSELELALSENNSQNIAEEIGDLFFTCVNLARHAKVDPEKALRDSNSKFNNRFHQMELALEKEGKSLSELSPEDWDAIWNSVKEKLTK